jgi:predicted RNase H-like HicB family nuclease
LPPRSEISIIEAIQCSAGGGRLIPRAPLNTVTLMLSRAVNERRSTCGDVMIIEWRGIKYKVLVECEYYSDGVIASAPAFRGCTIGEDSKEKAEEVLQSGIIKYLESMLLHDEPIPLGETNERTR